MQLGFDPVPGTIFKSMTLTGGCRRWLIDREKLCRLSLATLMICSTIGRLKAAAYQRKFRLGSTACHGLGITWILDGIEVTIVGAIAPVLRDQETLGLSAAQIGSSASAYVAGAVLGALLFGWLTDQFGRRLVFYITLLVYLAGVLLTATSWSFLSFALFRAITGLGIGGEYAAINSAIDELIPAKYRGRIDIIVNGSFWLGAAAGSGASLLFLDPHLLAPNLGWTLRYECCEH
jgi:MFS family permease